LSPVILEQQGHAVSGRFSQMLKRDGNPRGIAHGPTRAAQLRPGEKETLHTEKFGNPAYLFTPNGVYF
jgi:hypothetical protein